MDAEELKENRQPIRGWLAVFAGFQLLALAGHIVGCFGQAKNTGSEQVTPAFFPGIELQLIHTIWIVVIAVGIKRILQYHPRTRMYWIVVLVVSMPMILYSFVLNVQLSLTQGAVGFTDESTALRGALIRIAFSVAWLVYWVRSGRVQRTFSLTQHLPAAVSPSPARSIETPTSPVESERRLATLERLARLRDDGLLTEDEFERQKSKIIAS